MLRDLASDEARTLAEVQVLRGLSPDVLVLTDIDYDADGAALRELAQRLGGDLHPFALPPNTGVPTGLDIDGDGTRDGPRDAQGYGRFSGQGGMAVLSRWPVSPDTVTDLSDLLWRDLPGSRIAPDDPAHAVQRLSSTGHWIVPIAADPPFDLLVFRATPPVFDGPEDRNGRRNADEITLWQVLLDNALPGVPAPARPVVLAGHANLDPDRGEGLRDAIAGMLHHPRLYDPAPQGPFGGATVDWTEPRPGRLRVAYLVPDRAFRVGASGVHWEGTSSRHKPVWLDLTLAPP